MSNASNRVPSFIDGHVVGKIEGDFCQDGARFLFVPLNTSLLLRVKATNEEAAKALEEACRAHDEVVIAGYFCQSAEGCVRFDCYAVQAPNQFAAKAKDL